MVDKNDLEVVRMKKVLVIGSAVVDVVIHLPHLPEKSEDVHVTSQKMSLGGCAYNASDTIRHFKVPYIPFFPVGTGAYGDFVRNALAERGIVSPVPKPETENGCCYCFVEDDGERTFACYHGAEYRFQNAETEWKSAYQSPFPTPISPQKTKARKTAPVSSIARVARRINPNIF